MQATKRRPLPAEHQAPRERIVYRPDEGRRVYELRTRQATYATPEDTRAGHRERD